RGPPQVLTALRDTAKCTWSQPASAPEVHCPNPSASIINGDMRHVNAARGGAAGQFLAQIISLLVAVNERRNFLGRVSQGAKIMKRTVFFVYGVTAHLCFLATYAWLACFVGNLLVEHSVDSPIAGSVLPALLIDLGLIVLFGLQHSIMARPAFKEVWTKIVPRPIERSTYVFASCVVTVLLIWQWRAVDLVVWDVQNTVGRWLLHGLFVVGWLMVPAVSLMINHFDLFGTRQVWLYLRGKEYTSLPFRTPMLYAHIRHPLYVGWAIAFWATP